DKGATGRAWARPVCVLYRGLRWCGGRRLGSVTAEPNNGRAAGAGDDPPGEVPELQGAAGCRGDLRLAADGPRRPQRLREDERATGDSIPFATRSTTSGHSGV